jgi:chromosome segregation ATPase
MRVSAGAASIEAYLGRDTTLAPEVRADLDAIVKLYREMAAIEERRATLAEQTAEYRTRVDEINAQLFSLRGVKTATALSAHLAKKMREISERLQQATIRATDLQGELMACRIRMQDQLAELKLEREPAAQSKTVAAK